MPRSTDNQGRLFIGKLSRSVSKKELEEIFDQYGKLVRMEIKYGAELAYAFVDFEDYRDAEDAIRVEDGRTIRGRRIKIEWVKNKPRGYGGKYISYEMAENRGPGATRRRRFSRSRSRSPNGYRDDRRDRSSDRDRGRDRRDDRDRRRSGSGEDGRGRRSGERGARRSRSRSGERSRRDSLPEAARRPDDKSRADDAPPEDDDKARRHRTHSRSRSHSRSPAN